MCHFRGLVSLIVVLILPTAAYAQQNWAQEMFTADNHDFGTIARGAKAEYVFEMSNIFQVPIHISDVRASCGCTTPTIVKPWLQTYEKGGVLASINSSSFLGQRGATLTVTIDQPSYSVAQLHVKAFIRSDVACEPASANFGTVEQGEPATAQLTVTNYSVPNWQILAVKSDNPHLTGEVVPASGLGGTGSYTLQVRLDDKAPAGYVSDHLLLQTNDPQTPEIPVTVEGQVSPRVAVSPGSLFLGVLRADQKVTKQLVVRAKQPFRITSVDADPKSIHLALATDKTPKALQLVPVTFIAGDEMGKVVKTIRITTTLDSAPMVVKAYAVVTEQP